MFGCIYIRGCVIRGYTAEGVMSEVVEVKHLRTAGLIDFNNAFISDGLFLSFDTKISASDVVHMGKPFD